MSIRLGGAGGGTPADGSITEAMLAFDPATQAELTAAVDLPGARVRNSATQDIENNAEEPLTFDTATGAPLFNDGVWSAGNPTRLTAPEDGRYYVEAGVRWGNFTTGHRRLRLVLDGATPILADERSATAGTASSDQTISTILNLTAGQYIEAKVLHTQGATITLGAGSNLTHAVMQKVAD